MEQTPSPSPEPGQQEPSIAKALAAFTLREGGCSDHAIAVRLGIHPRTVWKLLKRAKDHIREQAKPHDAPDHSVPKTPMEITLSLIATAGREAAALAAQPPGRRSTEMLKVAKTLRALPAQNDTLEQRDPLAYVAGLRQELARRLEALAARELDTLADLDPDELAAHRAAEDAQIAAARERRAAMDRERENPSFDVGSEGHCP